MPPLRNMPQSERCTCCAKMFCRGKSSPELVSVNVQTLQLCASEKSCITCQRFALCHRVSPPTIMGSVTPVPLPSRLLSQRFIMTLAHFITGSRPEIGAPVGSHYDFNTRRKVAPQNQFLLNNKIMTFGTSVARHRNTGVRL